MAFHSGMLVFGFLAFAIWQTSLNLLLLTGGLFLHCALNVFNRLSFNKLGGATQLPFLSLLSEKNRLKCTKAIHIGEDALKPD